ncbi:MAG TPA: ACT domain-containing protein [Polyangia bacterium]|nr:ACT domain-containing protein [Polyangia bacterium]
MKREVDERELRRLIAEVTREVTTEAARVAARPGPGPSADVCAACAEAERRRGHRAVVTTTGKNRRGIVANIAQAIAAAGGDILDIAQTLAGDFFTMIIVVDVSALEVPFADFKSKLVAAVEALGAHCLVMHEEIVNALQRV